MNREGNHKNEDNGIENSISEEEPRPTMIQRNQYADFILSGGCFGTDIVPNSPNSQISEFMGWFLDQSSPNFNARLFYFEKILENDKMVEKNTNMLFFVKQIFEKLHASHQSWKKQFFSDIIYSIFIEFNYLFGGVGGAFPRPCRFHFCFAFSTTINEKCRYGL